MCRKKVAVAGSASAVGCYLKKELENDYDLVAMNRSGMDGAISFNLLDDKTQMGIPKGTDILVILAAVVSAKSDEDIIRMFDVNVQGTLKLCMNAKENGVKRIIYLSSVFAGIDAFLAGYGYYSISKKTAEETIGYFCRENGIELCILRPSQIYGDSWKFKRNQPFFYTILERAYKGEEIRIFGANDAYRNYIYISDLIEVIQKVIERKITGTYNVSFPYHTRLSEVAKTAIRVFDSTSQIVFCKDKPSIKDVSFCDTEDIYAVLNMGRLRSLEEGIRFIKKRLFVDGEG